MSPEPAEQDFHDPQSAEKFSSAMPEVYAAVSARRTAFDTLLWQVPALSLTAQSFLFTISLGAYSSVLARAITCLLSVVVAVLSMQILTRHRQAEITDAHWLEDYERVRYHGSLAHGNYWRNRRLGTSPKAGIFNSFGRLGGYQTWAVGMGLFGVASIVILVISLVAPQWLARP